MTRILTFDDVNRKQRGEVEVKERVKGDIFRDSHGKLWRLIPQIPFATPGGWVAK